MSEASPTSAAMASPRRDEAAILGERLAGLLDQPAAFLLALRAALTVLVDPAHRRSVERVSPGVDARYVVRRPVRVAVERSLTRALAEASSMDALRLAQHLAATDERDLRLFALPCLRRSLSPDPELTWQVMRRMGRHAGDWIEVDALADVWARGILAEAFRWAELEQLLYSRHLFERRLVGATLATIPHRVPMSRRADLRPVAVQRALEMIRLLMGDGEEMVQRALAWAIREWARVDRAAAAALLRHEAAIARRTRDGARAWVVRQALSSQPADLASDIRRQLDGIRRDPTAPSTSIAAEQSTRFAATLSMAADTVADQGDRFTRSRA